MLFMSPETPGRVLCEGIEIMEIESGGETWPFTLQISICTEFFKRQMKKVGNKKQTKPWLQASTDSRFGSVE